MYFRFRSCDINADSSQALSVWICSYYGKDIQKWHQRKLRCWAVNIRHPEREWREKKLYKSGLKCNETFVIRNNIFQTSLLLWYSSRHHRNVRFVRRLKSYEVTNLKLFLIDFSGLKLTSVTWRDEGSFILHSHNTLPLLLQFVSFLCAEGTVHRD